MDIQGIKEISQSLKPAPGVRQAYGMQGVLDYKNSQWRFRMSILNYLKDPLRIVLLTGPIEHERVQFVNGSGKYIDLDGVDNPAEANPKEYIIIPDDPRKLNKQTGLNATIVATNFVQGGGSWQKHLFKGGSKSYVDFDSTKNPGTIDDLRNYLKSRILKLAEIQVTSDNDRQFQNSIIYGYFNPIQKFQSQHIELSEFVTPQTVQKKATIKKDIYFDGSLIMAIDVPLNVTTDITFVFDSEFSLADYMQYKQIYETTISQILKH